METTGIMYQVVKWHGEQQVFANTTRHGSMYKKGVVNFKATTLCKYNGVWWYVRNGVLNTSTTLCKYGNAWYCVSGGKVAWNYTGLCKYGSAWYYVQKGVVNFKGNNTLQIRQCMVLCTEGCSKL